MTVFMYLKYTGVKNIPKYWQHNLSSNNKISAVNRSLTKISTKQPE